MADEITDREVASDSHQACPRCKSDDIESLDIEVAWPQLRSKCSCIECGAMWIAEFRFTGNCDVSE